MSIVFYEAPMSSATPVSWALAELEVPHERVRFDLAAGDQRKPEFLKINPNGKVPTLVVDGTPLFEALAIMIWLGDRYGVERGMWPKGDAAERLQALSWSTWGYVSFGSAVQRLAYATSERVEPELRSEGQAKLARQDTDALLTVLDGRLADARWILRQAFSLTDLIVASVVWYGTMVGIALDPYPNVKAWLERCCDRPQFKRSTAG
ncbi:MAG: glutathione S-transferase family protein [Gammaproteobacteria bacterium]|nr:glutathione S-transferase family protein [Gammaproteobacteria bacterium]